MKKKIVRISLPKIDGIGLKNATVDLEKGVVVVEYGEEEGQVDTEKDISSIAADFESAFEDLHQPTFRTTKKHMSKLDAFNKLLILSGAWNSFDEFEPDWEDLNQDKYYPLFEFINGDFEFSHAEFFGWILDPYISSFSFKTKERAEQFATKFIDLFRIALTN